MVTRCNRWQTGIEHDRQLIERFQDLASGEGLAESQLGAGVLDVEAVGRAVVEEGVSSDGRLKSGAPRQMRSLLRRSIDS
jgi:hypothetical protein